MKLFDYINVIFGKEKDWVEITNIDKCKNSFMLNRMMSIKFPIQGHMLNALKISQIGQAETWRMIAKKFNRVPGFIYTKTKGVSKDKAKTFNDDAVKIYMRMNEIGEKDFKYACEFNYEGVEKAIEVIEKTFLKK